MMVSKLVYIEHVICIKSVTVRKTLWNMLLSKKWEKMDCTENSVYMHHCQKWLIVLIFTFN